MRISTAVPVAEWLGRFSFLQKLVERAKSFAEGIAFSKRVLAGPDTLAKSADAISGILQHLRVDFVFLP